MTNCRESDPTLRSSDVAGTVEWPSIKISWSASYLDFEAPLEGLRRDFFPVRESESLTAFDTLLSNYYKQNLAGREGAIAF